MKIGHGLFYSIRIHVRLPSVVQQGEEQQLLAEHPAGLLLCLENSMIDLLFPPFSLSLYSSLRASSVWLGGNSAQVSVLRGD